MKPLFFSHPLKFRKWLEKNHLKEKELLVGFYKIASGKDSITWSESVDEALCYGWIDGIRKSIDEKSYTIRFTPRKPNSNWSTVNIKKVEELTKKGLMKPPGLEAFKKRKKEKSGIYTYENKPLQLDKSFEKKLKTNKAAWSYFQSKAPSYRRTAIAWVMQAKQDSTRLRRLESLIRDSEAGKNIKPLDY